MTPDKAHGQHEKALVEYDLAIHPFPFDSTAYNSRGDVYRALAKYDLALIEYTRAVESFPYEPTGYLALCRDIPGNGQG